MRWLSIVVALASLLSANPEEKHQKKPASASEKTQSSLTGCLDQRGERYILASEADMSKVTALKAKGMPDDNFARYIGHKVTVRGAQNGDIFEVVKIENISDTCAR
jgi:hypothetical protein